jgi:hypothetical protein
MNTGKPMFVFTPNERARLLADVGRTDVSADAFVADVETCLQAFDYAARGGVSAGLPTGIASHLSIVVQAATALRGALYALPNDVAMLIDLHVLSEGARRRIASDLSQLVEPLEDIAGAIVEIKRAAEGDSLQENVRFEGRLVRALASAFRNRLNRKPTADAESGFPATLADILQFAGHRLPSIAALSAAITPMRLRELIGERI